MIIEYRYKIRTKNFQFLSVCSHFVFVKFDVFVKVLAMQSCLIHVMLVSCTHTIGISVSEDNCSSVILSFTYKGAVLFSKFFRIFASLDTTTFTVGVLGMYVVLTFRSGREFEPHLLQRS